MKVLGLKPSQLLNFLEEEEQEEEEEAIIELINDMQLMQAKTQTEALAKQATTTRQQQFVMWARADIANQQGGDPNQTKSQILEALAVTLSMKPWLTAIGIMWINIVVKH